MSPLIDHQHTHTQTSNRRQGLRSSANLLTGRSVSEGAAGEGRAREQQEQESNLNRNIDELTFTPLMTH